MQGVRRLACAICMILILVFAIIHLGVGSGIIGRFRRYGDVFRPEIGLAAFNIVICAYALLVGGFGLFSVLTDRGRLSTVVGFAAVLLALFTLASLITALIINSLAVNYVNSQFLSYMNGYSRNRNSRDIIDKIQTKYVCCGSSTWLDWSRVPLNATEGITTRTTTPVIATVVDNVTSAITTGSIIIGTTITEPVIVGTSTNEPVIVGTATNEPVVVGTATNEPVVIGTATNEPVIVGTANNEPVVIGTATNEPVIVGTANNEPVVIGTATNEPVIVGTANRVAARVRRFDSETESAIIWKDTGSRLFNDIIENAKTNFLSWGEIIDDSKHKNQSAQKNIRRRRQTQTNYGGIYGLPSDFSVTLPRSCCANSLSSTSNLSNLYCISNTNNGRNNIHPKGCARPLGKDAAGQTLGLAVINSFLFVLSLAAIPLLIETDPDAEGNSPQNGYINQPAQQQQATYDPGTVHNNINPGMNNNTYNPEIPYDANNLTYSGYY